MADWWWRSGALLHPQLFILCQCASAWQTTHTPVAIVLPGLTGVQSDSCWLGALWYYTCAAPLPAPRSRFPVCACVLLCVCVWVCLCFRQTKMTVWLVSQNRKIGYYSICVCKTERLKIMMLDSIQFFLRIALTCVLCFITIIPHFLLPFCHLYSLHWCYLVSPFGLQVVRPAFIPSHHLH